MLTGNYIRKSEERQIEANLSKSKRKSKHKCCICGEKATWCDCDERHFRHFYCDEHLPFYLRDNLLHNVDGFFKQGKVYLIKVKYYHTDEDYKPFGGDIVTFFRNLLKPKNDKDLEKVMEMFIDYPYCIEKYHKVIEYIRNNDETINIDKIKHYLKRLRYHENGQ